MIRLCFPCKFLFDTSNVRSTKYLNHVQGQTNTVVGLHRKYSGSLPSSQNLFQGALGGKFGKIEDVRPLLEACRPPVWGILDL